ncbi:MAG TPA: ArsC family reductase [Pseudomonadales bacterium]|nr:ArsC family reductase [Pseudomonadales bacterium]
MIVLYGISACDSVEKARAWLDKQGLVYRFHDFRIEGLSGQELERWCTQLGWQRLLNQRSTTWRQLPAEIKQNLDQDRAQALLLEYPTLIKRPVLVFNETMHLGFNETDYQKIFA